MATTRWTYGSRGIVGDTARTRRPRHPRQPAEATRRYFEAYAPLVPVGSYVIVADTIVNGNPVWTGFGPGPKEALQLLSSATASSTPIPSSSGSA